MAQYSCTIFNESPLMRNLIKPKIKKYIFTKSHLVLLFIVLLIFFVLPCSGILVISAECVTIPHYFLSESPAFLSRQGFERFQEHIGSDLSML